MPACPYDVDPRVHMSVEVGQLDLCTKRFLRLFLIPGISENARNLQKP
jgi:hypothetical protein